MKKLIGFIALISITVFGLRMAPVNADEIITTEPAEVETTEDEGFAIPDVDLTNLNELWVNVVAWAGGVMGILSVFFVGVRFIADRGTIRRMNTMLREVKKGDDVDAEKVERLYQATIEAEKRNQSLNKSIIALMGMSKMDPKMKKEIMEAIENPGMSIDEVLKAQLVLIGAEIEENDATNETIKETTKSLLTKLAEDKKE